MPQLGPDTARLAQQNSARTVPDGPAPTGYFLGIVGQSPFRYNWLQAPASDIKFGDGDPNGELNAQIGTPYIDRTGQTFWINSDGADTWVQPAAAASRVSDFYNTGAPVGTNVASATLVDLEWPTLTAGPGILDLSTPDVPVTLYAGEYSVTATVVLGAGELTGGNPGEYILAILRITDGTTPMFAETATTLMGLSSADDEYASLTLGAVVAAGSTVEIMGFNTDTGVTATIAVTEVVVTGPSA